MWIVIRVLVTGAVAALMTAPLSAQRGGRPPNPARAQAAKPDTTKKAAPPGAVIVDYQDQDLKVVLDAIAAAGDLNVSLSNIPQKRVTFRLGRALSRDQLAETLKSFAESEGLKVTQTPTMMQIVGTADQQAAQRQQQNQQSLAQQLLQQNQQQQVRIFTYRLRHASAVQLAPVLSNLFSGFSGGGTGRGGTTVVPNANGGFNIINSPAQPPGNITITPNTSPFNPGGGNANPGRGGGRGQIAGNNNVAGLGAFGDIANVLSQRLQGISGSLSSQSGDIRIIPEESTNSLLIRATEADYALVQQLLQGIDIRPLQVLIEVTIAEVDRTRDLDIGVSGNAKRVKNGATSADITATAPSTASDRAFILELSDNNGTIKYDVAIAALQSRGDVRVLSLPVIIAQNNREAQLNVGSSRPFVQVSQTVPNDPTGRVQTVQYIDVGTVLTITPTINPDGYVNLQVVQADNSATNQVQFDAPIINKREARTQVFVRDGQTTVIGGLADNSRTRDVSGLPVLSRIPWIGPLIFGRTTHSDETRELFLFLTPHIISSDEDLDRYRNAVRDGSELLKQIDVGPRIVPKPDTMTIRRDTTRRDSLPPRRPPTDSSDAVKTPPIAAVLHSDSTSARRAWR